MMSATAPSRDGAIELISMWVTDCSRYTCAAAS